MSYFDGFAPRRRTSVSSVSPKTVIPTVPILKTIPYAIQDIRLFEGKWDECGCPRSTANRAQKVDLTPRQHAHMVALDESLLHYIFDRKTYLTINEAPRDAPLGKWRTQRCKEGRLFVAKPPAKPPSSEPWRHDSPAKLGFLQPGWRAWDPQDVALTISEVNSAEEYQEHLETFFLWLNIEGAMKAQMMETAEAWMLACGEETDHLKVKNRRPCKIDRCFVTSDLGFFELVMAKWDRMSFFSRSLKCGEKMKYMRRLWDIRLDPFSVPFLPEARVDPCEMGLRIQGHPLCGIHGQYKLRRVPTAPTGVPRRKLLSPRARPQTRARKLEAKPCSGKGWSPSELVEQGYVANWHL